MNILKSHKYIRIALALLVLFLSYLIVEPFLNAILTSFILTYIFYPIYKKLFSYLKNKTLASLTVTSFILLLVLLPLMVIIRITATQASNFYYSGGLTSVNNFLSSFMGNTELQSYVTLGIKSLTSYITNLVSSFIIQIPKFIISSLIIVFMVFYLLKDWESIYNKSKNLIFLTRKETEKIMNHIKIITNAIIYGFFSTAILEGILATIGFLIFGIPHAFFFGLLTILFVILPGVGAGVIWVPAAIWLAYKGKILMALLFAVYSFIFMSGIENVIRPSIIGVKADVSPIIMLLGIIGGLLVFGFIGIVIGPLILSITHYIIIKDYLLTKK